MAAQGGGADTPAYMEHLVGAYTFKGRSNDDADKATMYDSSGNGNHGTLNFTTWGKTTYGYNGWENNMLCIGGVNSEDVTIEFSENMDGWTFICDRQMLRYNYGALLGSGQTQASSPVLAEYSTNNVVHFANCSGGSRYSSTPSSSSYGTNDGVFWMNLSKYQNVPMTQRTETRSSNTLRIGRVRGDVVNVAVVNLRGLYVFNTSLDPADIEHFIINNIDPTYTLP